METDDVRIPGNMHWHRSYDISRGEEEGEGGGSFGSTHLDSGCRV